MRRIARYIATRAYKPLLVRYLSKTRTYSYRGMVVEVPPQVFHPGFFFSTRILLNYLDNLELKNKSVLELGAGSGLLSIHAAKNNANVTASDINTMAVLTLKKNAKANDVKLNVVLSDLFRDIPAQTFDYILINPPYYKKDPATEAERAWYCGSKGEYFEELFGNLSGFVHRESLVLMVLSDGCDLNMIRNFASQNGFALNQLVEKKNILETNYIFRIEASLDSKPVNS